MTFSIVIFVTKKCENDIFMYYFICAPTHNTIQNVISTFYYNC